MHDADVVTHTHLTAKGYDSWACDGATDKGFAEAGAMRPPVSSGNKGLCLLKGRCFHPETKTFVSFDAGGAAQQMGDKVQRVTHA